MAPSVHGDLDYFGKTALPFTTLVKLQSLPGMQFWHLDCLSLVYRKTTNSEDAMAPVIEFYIPSRFHKRVKWTPQAQRGKLLEFSAEIRKSA